MGQAGPEPSGGGAGWLAVLLALPAAALCCGGPLLLAGAGGALAAAAAWVRGYAGLALLSAAGLLCVLWWARRSARRGRARPRPAWRKGEAG